ncbi:hypothetical protein Dimus_008570, partial [Dionaea muscipula]
MMILMFSEKKRLKKKKKIRLVLIGKTVIDEGTGEGNAGRERSSMMLEDENPGSQEEQEEIQRQLAQFGSATRT